MSCLPTLKANRAYVRVYHARFEVGSKAWWCGGGWAAAKVRHGKNVGLPSVDEGETMSRGDPYDDGDEDDGMVVRYVRS